MSFVHLHNHTAYSILDGASKIPELVQAARQLKQPALAITDHGSMAGTQVFHEECVKHGIKPIIGIEAYLAPRSHTLREPVFFGPESTRSRDVSGSGAYTHLTILAADSAGVRHLFRGSAEAATTGFYRKPRFDVSGVAQGANHLIVTSGCPSSIISTRLRLDQKKEAYETAYEYKSTFPHFYLEIMNHGIPFEKELCDALIEMSRKMKIPLVATNDLHYTKAEDAHVHDALLCVQTRSKLADENRFKFSGSGYYLKSREEMEGLFPKEALDNTLEIAEIVGSYDNFSSTPKPIEVLDDDFWVLKDTVYRDAEASHLVDNRYAERLKYELDVIETTGFAGYFIALSLILKEARARGIRIGPGRGSGGASLVAYILGITQVDPIYHGLLFERFLNPHRISPPDIDIDVDENRRDELIQIATDEFKHVAAIGTFGTIKSKAAIDDAVRVLGGSPGESKRIKAGLPPPIHGRAPTIADGNFDDSDNKVIKLASGLEDAIRSEGIHPAGVIISTTPLNDVIPLRHKNGRWISQWDQHSVDAVGLIKFDFLGLRNLGVIDECLSSLQKRGRTCDLLSLSLDDAQTYAMVSQGFTTGVFQLDSPGMQGLLRAIRPSDFSDISAVLALFRPGPMGASSHTAYGERKRRHNRTVRIHPELNDALEPLLWNNYGLIIYQEDVINVLKEMAGYTIGEADLIRKAMGKKQLDILNDEQPKYIERMRTNGYSEDAARTLWETLLPFADYGFNKAHATGYAYISYWTAYLKSNYPNEYMAALLSSVSDSPDKHAEYAQECARLGVHILPPDINESGESFTPVNAGITYGLASIKGIGQGVLPTIIKGAPYKSLDDMLRRLDKKAMNGRVLTALAKSGTLDSFGPREGIVTWIESLAQDALEDRKNHAERIQGLRKRTYTIPDYGWETSATARAAWEQETLGVTLTKEPVTLIAERYLSEIELEFLRDHLPPGDTPVKIVIKGHTVHECLSNKPSQAVINAINLEIK